MSTSLKVAFRADASLDIGTGHVMRCLTLADALRQKGATCRFLCSPLEGNLIDAIRQRGHAMDILPLPSAGHLAGSEPDLPAHQAWLCKSWQLDAQQVVEALRGQKQDWLVVDHYALDARWEKATSAIYERLLVIDDLADRHHSCDGLLDQNLGSMTSAYEDKVPVSCQLFVGPKFTLLRPEFAALRHDSLKRRASGALQTILVTMGGVDKGNATTQVLEALKSAHGLPECLQIDVVMGQHAPWLSAVRATAEGMPWRTEVHVNTSQMADLMVRSDLAIGAAGSTSWERCALGLPTVMAVLAVNQRQAARSLEQVGAVMTVEVGDSFVQEVKSCVERLALEPELMRHMSAKAAQVTSGQGAEVLASWMQETNMSELGILREIGSNELELILSWRNAPSVRNNMFTRQVISLKDHTNWWAKVQQRSDQKYFMYEHRGSALGVMSFNDIDHVNGGGSWGFYASPLAPKGTGSRMWFLALEWFFGNMGLHRLYSEVLDFNEASLGLHRKFGFVQEGVKRKHHKMEDGYHDVFCFGMLMDEWAAKRESMKQKLLKNLRG